MHIYIVTSLSDIDVPDTLRILKETNASVLERLEGVIQVKNPLAFLYLEEPYGVVLLREDPMWVDLEMRFKMAGLYTLVI